MGHNAYARMLRRALVTAAATAAICLAGVLACARLSAARREAPPAPYESTAAGRSYLVILDAGHGGSDGGAVGTRSGTPEAGLNLDVAQRVKALLEAEGVDVIMTRSDEKALGPTKKADMQARGRILADKNADAAVSIHMNRFTDPSVNGPMAFYMKGSAEGEKLAAAIIDAVCKAAGRSARAANPGDYFVIRKASAPAAIIECGFLSNPSDEQLLLTEDHRAKLAFGIASGILAYLRSASAPAAPSSPAPSPAPSPAAPSASRQPEAAGADPAAPACTP